MVTWLVKGRARFQIRVHLCPKLVSVQSWYLLLVPGAVMICYFAHCSYPSILGALDMFWSSTYEWQSLPTFWVDTVINGGSFVIMAGVLNRACFIVLGPQMSRAPGDRDCKVDVQEATQMFVTGTQSGCSRLTSPRNESACKGTEPRVHALQQPEAFWEEQEKYTI